MSSASALTAAVEAALAERNGEVFLRARVRSALSPAKDCKYGARLRKWSYVYACRFCRSRRRCADCSLCAVIQANIGRHHKPKPCGDCPTCLIHQRESENNDGS